MKASERVWEFLESEDMHTRGEAMEMFADAVLAVADPGYGHSNGSVIDALEVALDKLCEDPKKQEELNKWLDEMLDELYEEEDEE